MSTAYIRGMKFELAAPVDVYVAPIVFGEDMTRQCREERALAVLLDEIFGPECERVHDASGAPVVLSRGRRVEAEVSISHSMHYAAVAVGSPGYEVGIDIEERRSQLSRVCPRVLSAAELSAYKERPDGLLEAWTLKEALYKAWRRHSGGEIDFGRQLHLPMPPGTGMAHTTHADGTPGADYAAFSRGGDFLGEFACLSVVYRGISD